MTPVHDSLCSRQPNGCV